MRRILFRLLMWWAFRRERRKAKPPQPLQPIYPLTRSDIDDNGDGQQKDLPA